MYGYCLNSIHCTNILLQIKRWIVWTKIKQSSHTYVEQDLFTQMNKALKSMSGLIQTVTSVVSRRTFIRWELPCFFSSSRLTSFSSWPAPLTIPYLGVGTVLLVKTPDLHLEFESGFKPKPFSTAITTRPDESSNISTTWSVSRGDF